MHFVRSHLVPFPAHIRPGPNNFTHIWIAFDESVGCSVAEMKLAIYNILQMKTCRMYADLVDLELMDYTTMRAYRDPSQLIRPDSKIAATPILKKNFRPYKHCLMLEVKPAMEHEEMLFDAKKYSNLERKRLVPPDETIIWKLAPVSC